MRFPLIRRSIHDAQVAALRADIDRGRGLVAALALFRAEQISGRPGTTEASFTLPLELVERARRMVYREEIGDEVVELAVWPATPISRPRTWLDGTEQQI